MNDITTSAFGSSTGQTRHERELGFQLGDLVRSDVHGITASVVTVIGTNFIELEWYNARRPSREFAGQSIRSRSDSLSTSTRRIHFDDLGDFVVVSDPAALLAEMTAEASSNLSEANLRIQALMARLTGNGSSPNAALKDPDASGQALRTMSTMVDPRVVRAGLEEARNETIPELYRDLGYWTERLSAVTRLQLTMASSRLSPMSMLVQQLDTRLFTIELYAGFTESIYHFRRGVPAGIHDKIHVFQRKLFMDEECLLDYDAGGMSFENLDQYFEWMSKPGNMERILPFRKSVVAMQVRRHRKDRDAGNLLDAFINIQREIDDKSTYLFIRNGENLYCLRTAIEFGERLFPDMLAFNPGQPTIIVVKCGRIETLIPRREYEAQRDLYEGYQKELEAWSEERDARKSSGLTYAEDLVYPVRKHHLDFSSFVTYEPFDESSVYFDDAQKLRREQMDSFNRFTLILQGLLDRSDVLAPHSGVRLWDAGSFASNVEPILEDRALYHGVAPDFEAFRSRLNACATEGDMFVGQQVLWEMAQAEKENARQRSDYRIRSSTQWRRFRPHNNPGPGRIAPGKLSGKGESRKVRFEWMRGKANGYYYTDTEFDILSSTSMPLSSLLNVSAYQPGDYRQFFQDQRTRHKYLQWAPLLLAAEDWHACQRVAPEV